MSNRAMLPELTKDYVCPDCGSTADTPVFHLCDGCILKFYFDNPNASNFMDWSAENE